MHGQSVMVTVSPLVAVYVMPLVSKVVLDGQTVVNDETTTVVVSCEVGAVGEARDRVLVTSHRETVTVSPAFPVNELPQASKVVLDWQNVVNVDNVVVNVVTEGESDEDFSARQSDPLGFNTIGVTLVRAVVLVPLLDVVMKVL